MLLREHKTREFAHSVQQECQNGMVVTACAFAIKASPSASAEAV